MNCPSKFCPISGLEKKETDQVNLEVLNFAIFYRDKLNIEQKQKIAQLLRMGARLDKRNKNYITTQACLNMFFQMKKPLKSWQKIKQKLKEELLQKELITEKEFYDD